MTRSLTKKEKAMVSLKRSAMQKAEVNGIELEYEETGVGEPVLLITCGPIADGFLPFFAEGVLADLYRLITYHRRGQGGSTHSSHPVSFAEQAADAAGLLQHLGVSRAHIAGHSTGGTVALQLALDYPGLVHTLALFEPTLMAVPSAGAFFAKAGPSLEAYGAGDREGAMASFLSAVCGLDWDQCRTVIENHVPGAVAQAMKDADTFFGIDLPAHNAWTFGPEQAAEIRQPVLSVLGTKTEELFVEGRDLLHSWFPQLKDCTIEGAGHLLQMECPEPVAQGLAMFIARHPIEQQQMQEANSE
jgi:pimeloyl-ACP methyl ester carboxylesterase